ncbi:MAG: hypothetical protein QQN41_00100 [Nitrosopumilus sp.]
MENPSFIFSSGPIELKEEGENFYAEGYLSNSDLDLVNDIVTKDCLLNMAEQMKKRVIKMDVEHESFRGNNEVELEINKTIIPVAKIDDFSIDEKGLKIRTVLNKHSSRFKEVMGSIKDGFLDAFSIAFIPVKSKIIMRNGKEIRMLDEINLLNAAYTGNPVNTTTTMTNVFAKSLEFLKDQETKSNHSHETDIIKLKEVKKMSDEDNKEETKEEEASESESSDTEAEAKAKHGKDGEEEDEDEKDPKKKKKKVSKKDEESESEESEESTEESDEESDSKEDSSDTETKSEIKKLRKELMEVKAVLKRPILKSRFEQKDKSENFVEEKTLHPLDVIA